MQKFRTIAVTVLAAGLLGGTLAACSSGSSDSSTAAGGSSSSAAADTAPIAKVDSLTGKSTSVKLDTGFTDALTSLGLTPGTVGTATLDASTGTITFPITGGNVTVYNKGAVTPYVQGEIDHQGSGLSLTAGSTKVELTNFVIDPGNDSNLKGDVSVNGKVAVQGATLFDLNGSTLQPITVDDQGVATLTGTEVSISPDAATLLNQTFKTDAVKGGLLVGVATLLVNTK
ncbi:hypothetical protein ACXR2U_17545 [Jatrophihabitans sp. YIM 134969]